ncbi:MAG: hypothetical protein AABY22_30090 [Nanoarchaeota archaeon]
MSQFNSIFSEFEIPNSEENKNLPPVIHSHISLMRISILFSWEPEPIKESMFGSLEQQKKQAICLHEWKEKKGIIFDYIVVSSRCKLCGIYKK